MLDRLLELAEKKGERGLWTEEYTDLKKKLQEVITKSELYERSYHESERCLIERGKIIQNLKTDLEQTNKLIEYIKNPEFLEKLAIIEHEQWIEWATALMEKETLSPERIKRWKLLLVDYPNLSSEYKEQDRKYARKIIELILSQYKE